VLPASGGAPARPHDAENAPSSAQTVTFWRRAPVYTCDPVQGRLKLAGRLMLGALLVSLPDPSRAQEAIRSADEMALVQLERAWDQAFLHNDTALIDKVLAREFVAVYPDGSKGDRDQELANAAAFNQRIDSSTLDDFTIRLYDDTAVVLFRRSLVGPSKGQRLEITFRYIDVFVRRDGRWQCVASQSVKVPA
jgi:hypothetical protein